MFININILLLLLLMLLYIGQLWKSIDKHIFIFFYISRKSFENNFFHINPKEDVLTTAEINDKNNNFKNKPK